MDPIMIISFFFFFFFAMGGHGHATTAESHSSPRADREIEFSTRLLGKRCLRSPKKCEAHRIMSKISVLGT